MRLTKAEGSSRLWGRVLGATLLVIAAAFLVSACGSSKDNTKTSTSAGGGGGEDAVLAQARKLAKLGESGLIYPTKEVPTSPADFEAYGEWRGPTTAPPHKPGARVEVILCTKAAAACVDGGEGAVEAGKHLGWKVDVIDGGGTPQGYVKAFDTAFSRKPDAIIGIAVPELLVAQQLAEAKKRGIVTVQTDLNPTSEPRYDASGGFIQPPMGSLAAANEIARTDGKANSIVVVDKGYPALIAVADAYKKSLSACSGCKYTQTSWQITDASNPTKVNAIVSAALAQNPNANGMYLPYSIALAATLQTIEQAGKADQVKVNAKDADSIEIAAVREGKSPFTVGMSVRWAGWASIDQVLRGLAGKPFLAPGNKVGVGLVTVTPTNAPKDDNVDSMSTMIDYKSKYREIWDAAKG